LHGSPARSASSCPKRLPCHARSSASPSASRRSPSRLPPLRTAATRSSIRRTRARSRSTTRRRATAPPSGSSRSTARATRTSTRSSATRSAPTRSETAMPPWSRCRRRPHACAAVRARLDAAEARDDRARSAIGDAGARPSRTGTRRRSAGRRDRARRARRVARARGDRGSDPPAPRHPHDLLTPPTRTVPCDRVSVRRPCHHPWRGGHRRHARSSGTT
jgi:hypothetical protein